MNLAVALVLAPLRVLSLAQAIETAESNQPDLRQSLAAVAAAEARVEIARAPLLPQLNGTAQYQRTTANFVARPSFIPSQGGTTTPDPTFRTFNFFTFGLTLTQYIWDFGQVTGRWNASKVTAEAEQANARTIRLTVQQNVRNAYFTARAQKALVEVAKETLANQERHLSQIEAFVRVGTRPEIDLAQARTDRANARVNLINAEGNYEAAKAALNRAMGVAAATDYDVEDVTLEPVGGEEQPTDALVGEAEVARPELQGLERQIRAQRYTVSAFKGGYGPSLNFSTGITDSGTELTNLRWNWNATVNLNWALFNGLQTRGQIREAQAQLARLEAMRDGQRLQVRLEIDQARLAVRAARAAIDASAEALEAARQRLRLAEGRYQTGVGSSIELSDAQVALTNAEAQRVQADYNLATARVNLLRALGRL